MNYREAMQYVDELRPLGSVMGLDTMRRLCAALGDPQNQLKFVHIAGTNGKGSTLAYISTIMQAAGYRVGRYISPAVKDYRERFQVNGREITQSGLCKYLEPVKAAAEQMAAEGGAHPTLFEVETAVAFLYFLDRECDLVVLETGLGGALDATNVADKTLAAFCFHQHGSYGYSGGQSGADRAGEGGYYKEQVLCRIGKTAAGSDEGFAAVCPGQKGEVSDGGYISREADQVRRDEAEL